MFQLNTASDVFEHIATRPKCGKILKPYKGYQTPDESQAWLRDTQVRSQSPGYMDDPQPSLFYTNRKVQRLNGFGSEKA